MEKKGPAGRSQDVSAYELPPRVVPPGPAGTPGSGGGVRVAGAPPGRGRAGYVLAGDRGLYWRLTAMQNMEFFGGIAGLRPAEARAEARKILRSLGADALESKRVEVCSTGQRGRLAI